jgi:hypothetical protein
VSDVLFPELPGLEWDLSKKPIFNTKIMESVNGRELRASYQAVPKYEISLSFGFLRESKGRNELQQLESFFLNAVVHSIPFFSKCQTIVITVFIYW